MVKQSLVTHTLPAYKMNLHALEEPHMKNNTQAARLNWEDDEMYDSCWENNTLNC